MNLRLLQLKHASGSPKSLEEETKLEKKDSVGFSQNSAGCFYLTLHYLN